MPELITNNLENSVMLRRLSEQLNDINADLDKDILEFNNAQNTISTLKPNIDRKINEKNRLIILISQELALIYPKPTINIIK